MPPVIGIPTARSTAGDVLLSIRDQIPDPSTDGTAQTDGTAFTNATLIRWLNDAMRIMATSASIVTDWFGLASISGMDVYELPQTTLTVEQLWYDGTPCHPSPEYDALGDTIISGRAYFFGPHSIHNVPRIHIFPAADRNSATTPLASTISSSATSIALTSSTDFSSWGFAAIEDELILYRNIVGNTMGPMLRGQGSTTAAAHNAGATIIERNIVMKVTRLPWPITTYADVVEIPMGLIPIIELYVLSKVREAEQEAGLAASLRREFQGMIRELEQKVPFAGIRQGLQVRATPPGPTVYGGRVIIP